MAIEVMPAVAAGQLRVGLSRASPRRKLVDRALEPAQQPEPGSGVLASVAARYPPTAPARKKDLPSRPDQLFRNLAAGLPTTDNKDGPRRQRPRVAVRGCHHLCYA